MYGDLVRDSLSLCASTLRVVLGSSRGWTGASDGTPGDRRRGRRCRSTCRRRMQPLTNAEA